MLHIIKRYSYLFFLAISLVSSKHLNAQSRMNQLYLKQITTRDSIFSKVLNEQREFWIQIPDNYIPESNVKYPVVYILDGHSLMSKLSSVHENYWGHFLPNMILVGISNENKRIRDLTVSKVTERNGGIMNMETGGADRFSSFIETELIPYIDSKYPTSNHRTLIGHSFAGLFTLNVLINHPHLFQNYIAIDPSVDWDNRIILTRAKQKLSTISLKDKSLFISLAAEQLNFQDENVTIENVMNDSSEYSLFPRSIIEFSDWISSLEIKSFNYEFRIYPNDLHGTVTLPSIKDGLISLFDWYQFRHSQQYNNPDTSLNELVNLLQEQKNILTDNFGYSTPPLIEDLFIGYGYMFMQFEQWDKAYYFIECAIEYYPYSDLGFAAMAEFYTALNEPKNALSYYRKAFEINKNEVYQKKIQEIKEKMN
jgi:predicted alpha/beta superfamily hydrolase